MSSQSSEGFYLHHLPRFTLLQDFLNGATVLILGPAALPGARMARKLGASVVACASLTEPLAGSTLSDPGIHFHHVEGWERLPFADQQFTLVLAFEAIADAANLRGVCAELRRVLTPDGLLLAAVPNFARDELQEILGNGPAPFPFRAPSELYEGLDRLFRHVTLLTQTPFFGYTLLESTDAGPPKPFTIAYDLLEGRGEPPLFYLFLASALPLVLEEDRLVQVPFAQVADRLQEGLRLTARLLERRTVRMRELESEFGQIKRDGDRHKEASQRFRSYLHRLAGRLEIIAGSFETLADAASELSPEIAESIEHIQERLQELQKDFSADRLEALERPEKGGSRTPPSAVSSDELSLLMEGLRGGSISEQLRRLETSTIGGLRQPGPKVFTAKEPIRLHDDPELLEDVPPFTLPGPTPYATELRIHMMELRERLHAQTAALLSILSWREKLGPELGTLENRLRRELESPLVSSPLRQTLSAVWYALRKLLEDDALVKLELPEPPPPLDAVRDEALLSARFDPDIRARMSELEEAAETARTELEDFKLRVGELDRQNEALRARQEAIAAQEQALQDLRSKLRQEQEGVGLDAVRLAEEQAAQKAESTRLEEAREALRREQAQYREQREAHEQEATRLRDKSDALGREAALLRERQDAMLKEAALLREQQEALKAQQQAFRSEKEAIQTLDQALRLRSGELERREMQIDARSLAAALAARPDEPSSSTPYPLPDPENTTLDELAQVLKTREQRLRQKANDLLERERSLGDQERALKEREQNLYARSDELGLMRRALEADQLELKVQQGLLEEERKVLNSRELALRAKELGLEDVTREQNEREARLGAYKLALDAREAGLGTQRKALEQYEINVKNRESENDSRDKALRAQEQAIVSREQGLTVREQSFNMREQALSARERALEELAHALALREKELNSKQLSIEDVIAGRRQELEARHHARELKLESAIAAREAEFEAKMHAREAEFESRIRVRETEVDAALATRRRQSEETFQRRESEIEERLQALVALEGQMSDAAGRLHEAQDRERMLQGKDKELGAMQQRAKEVSDRLAQYERESAELSRTLTGLEAERDSLKAQLAQHVEGSGSLQEQIAALQQSLEEATGAQAELEELRPALDSALERTRELSSQVEALESEREALLMSKADLEQHLLELQQNGLNAKQRQAQEAELNELRSALEAQTEALLVAQQETASKVTALEELQAQLIQLTLEKDEVARQASNAEASFTEQKGELEARVEALYRQRATLEEQVEAARQEAARQMQVAAGLDVLQTELEDLRAQHEKAQSRLEELQQELEDSRALQSTPISEMQDRVLTLEEGSARVQVELENATDRARELEKKLEERSQLLSEREAEVAQLKEEVQRAWRRSVAEPQTASVERTAEPEGTGPVGDEAAAQLKTAQEKIEQLQKDLDARHLLLTRLQKELELKSTHNRNLQEIIGKQREDLEKIKVKVKEAIEYIGKLNEEKKEKDLELERLRSQLKGGTA